MSKEAPTPSSPARADRSDSDPAFADLLRRKQAIDQEERQRQEAERVREEQLAQLEVARSKTLEAAEDLVRMFDFRQVGVNGGVPVRCAYLTRSVVEAAAGVVRLAEGWRVFPGDRIDLASDVPPDGVGQEAALQILARALHGAGAVEIERLLREAAEALVDRKDARLLAGGLDMDSRDGLWAYYRKVRDHLRTRFGAHHLEQVRSGELEDPAVSGLPSGLPGWAGAESPAEGVEGPADRTGLASPEAEAAWSKRGMRPDQLPRLRHAFLALKDRNEDAFLELSEINEMTRIPPSSLDRYWFSNPVSADRRGGQGSNATVTYCVRFIRTFLLNYWKPQRPQKTT